MLCAGADAKAGRDGQSGEEGQVFAINRRHGGLVGVQQEGASGEESFTEEAHGYSGSAVGMSRGGEWSLGRDPHVLHKAHIFVLGT